MSKKSTRKSRSRKSSDFPLTKHPRGYWCKRFKELGQAWKMAYFKKVADDPDGQLSLAMWLDQKDELLAGRTPRVPGEGLTVMDACNRFLTHKRRQRETGELSARSFEEYNKTTDRLIRVFGKHRLVADLNSQDFADLRADIAKTNGLIRIGNEIQRTRSLFKFCYDEGLIDRPMRYGQSFAKPSQKSLRMARASKGPQMFTPEQIRSILNVATVNIKGMVLLAINGALGNTDVAELPTNLVDFTAGWLVYPRVKTGIDRRIPLWGETLAALREVLTHRRPAKNPDDERLLFIGKRGEGYVGNHRGYRVHQEFARSMKLAGLTGRTFYDLRRTFETVAESSKDLSAVQSIMGHSPPANDMAAVYRQRVDDVRLRAVVDTVHRWLFPLTTDGDTSESTGQRRATASEQVEPSRLRRAVVAARDAIAAASGPTRQTLESVWLSDIDKAEAGDGEAIQRIVEMWEDGTQ